MYPPSSWVAQVLMLMLHILHELLYAMPPVSLFIVAACSALCLWIQVCMLHMYSLSLAHSSCCRHAAVVILPAYSPLFGNSLGGYGDLLHGSGHTWGGYDNSQGLFGHSLGGFGNSLGGLGYGYGGAGMAAGGMAQAAGGGGMVQLAGGGIGPTGGGMMPAAGGMGPGLYAGMVLVNFGPGPWAPGAQQPAPDSPLVESASADPSASPAQAHNTITGSAAHPLAMPGVGAAVQGEHLVAAAWHASEARWLLAFKMPRAVPLLRSTE